MPLLRPGRRRPVVRTAGWLVLLVAVGPAACVAPSGGVDVSSSGAPTSASSASTSASLAGLVPAEPVAQLSVLAHQVLDGPNQQAQVRLLPEVVATGDEPVRIRYDDFWLVVPHESVRSWSGLEDPAPWTTTTPDGAVVGLLPVNVPGTTERLGQGTTTATRWDHPPVQPGTSSRDDGMPPGALVFHVPEQDDGSLGIMGLALTDPERDVIAVVELAGWPEAVDGDAF